MGGNYKTVGVAEVAEINPDSISNGYPHRVIEYIDISSVDRGNLLTTKLLSLDEAPSRAKRLIRDGDTIISTVRPGRRAYLFVDGLSKNTVVSTGFAVLRPNPEYLDERFLYYAVTSNRFIDNLSKQVTGSAYPAVSATVIGSSKIPLPPQSEQRQIADILGSLDDRMGINRSMNETLEQMAQTIFQSWFIDFDPVKAKAEGRKPYGMDAHTAALFPDEFVESDLGLIPNGWSVQKIKDVAKLRNGKRPNVKEDIGSPTHNIPIYGGAGPMAYTDKPLYEADVLITGRVGTLGQIHRISTPVWPSDNTIVLFPVKPELFDFIRLQLERLSLAALNRGSTQPLLTQKDIKEQALVVPPSFILSRFDQLCRSLFNLIENNNSQNQTLNDIRDALLPRLVLGEIRVPDAHGVTKEVL